MREICKCAEHPGAEDIKVILCEEPLSLPACLNTQTPEMIRLPQITDPCSIHLNLLFSVVIRDELITAMLRIISDIKDRVKKISNVVMIG